MDEVAHQDRAGSPEPPAVVVFDVNETLSDMAPLGDAFQRVGLRSHDVEPWFAGVLRDGFALTAVGSKPAFADVASEALRVCLARRDRADDRADPNVESAVEDVMGTFSSLHVHPDVVAGVGALRDLGVRVVTLSNGSTAVAAGLLERAGLSDEVERLMSVQDAPAWKPHPDSYRYALSACAVSAGEAMLVAAHPWDIDGAARAGLRTGWLNRARDRYPSYFTPAEVTVHDLPALADAWR